MKKKSGWALTLMERINKAIGYEYDSLRILLVIVIGSAENYLMNP